MSFRIASSFRALRSKAQEQLRKNDAAMSIDAAHFIVPQSGKAEFPNRNLN